jgi:transcriptional regulator with XRE-family HTH domain
MLLMQTSRAMTRFAKNVKALLREKGLTQRQLAEAIGMDESQMSGLLNRQPNTTLETIEAIADVIGVDPGLLISRAPRKKVGAA